MTTLPVTSQGGFLTLSAGAFGFDTGAMYGLDGAKVDDAFSADASWTSSFLVNLDHGEPVRLACFLAAPDLRRSARN